MAPALQSQEEEQGEAPDVVFPPERCARIPQLIQTQFPVGHGGTEPPAALPRPGTAPARD